MIVNALSILFHMDCFQTPLIEGYIPSSCAAILPNIFVLDGFLYGIVEYQMYRAPMPGKFQPHQKNLEKSQLSFRRFLKPFGENLEVDYMRILGIHVAI